MVTGSCTTWLSLPGDESGCLDVWQNSRATSATHCHTDKILMLLCSKGFLIFPNVLYFCVLKSSAFLSVQDSDQSFVNV